MARYDTDISALGRDSTDTLGSRLSARMSRLLMHRGVLLGVPAFIFAVLGLTLFFVYEGFQRSNSVAAENSIWVVGQIEPASLRFELALERYQGGPFHPEFQKDLILQTGVLLSRMKIIDVHLEQKQLPEDPELLELWARVIEHRPELYDLLEEAKLGVQRPDLLGFVDRGRALDDAVREFNVRAMQVAVDASSEDRHDLRNLVVDFAVASFIAIIFLLGAFWMLFSNSRKLAITREKEAITRDSLQKTYDFSGEGIVMLDKEAKVVMANPAAMAIFGCRSMDEINPHFVQNLLFSDPRAEAVHTFINYYLRSIVPAGGEVTDEACQDQIRATRMDGEPIDLDVLLTRDRDHDNNRVLIAFIRDVTEQIKREEDLRAARDEAVSAVESRLRFFAAMSHEMRTPISGAIAAIDAIKTRTTPDASQLRLLGIAEQSAHSALDQINNVLDLAWMERGEVQAESVEFNLSEVIEDVVTQYRALAESSGNEIELELPDRDEAFVEGPLRVIMRPINNLLSNALKHTKDGTISVRAAVMNGQARIEIEDTGEGIDPKFHDRIFKPFEMGHSDPSWKTTGSGLGLPITRHAVESLGGKIGLSSKPGMGSLFWFTIPIKTVTPARPDLKLEDSSDVQGPTEGAPLKILLVEDNDASRLLALEMLEWFGQDVTEACNGAEAVQLAADTAYDLILMDVSMPIMSGTEATGAIREFGASRKAKIIGVTAFGSPDEIEEFQSCGMDMVLPKPLTSRDLTRILSVKAPAVGGSLTGLVSLDSLNAATASLVEEIDTFLAAMGEENASSAELSDQAHKTKGLAAMLELKKLSQLLGEMEGHLSNGDVCGARSRQHNLAEMTLEIRKVRP